MKVDNIDINKLYVSNINVRKKLTSEEDETGISDLALDINTNGLINPITVRKQNDKYEIIAGQRRYLAIKQLNFKEIPCNILEINNQKAEEISLVENVQRNQMTTYDKVCSYSRLYNVYNKDIDRVVSAIHISKQTLLKYIKINSLPEEILNKLDKKDDTKISIDVAMELTKLPNNINYSEILNKLTTLTNTQKINAIKQFRNQGDYNIDILENICDKLLIENTNYIESPSQPYVFDTETRKNIIIPSYLYSKVIQLIKDNTETLYY